MAKLAYIGKYSGIISHKYGFKLYRGQQQEVDDAVAADIIKSFPDEFEIVDKQPEKKKMKDKEDAK